MLINRETLAAALPACTKDVSRYHLKAVQIMPDGCVRATDGTIALMASTISPTKDEEFPTRDMPEMEQIEAPVLIDASVIERLIKGTPKRPTIPVLSCIRVGRSGGAAVLVSTDLEMPTVARVEQDSSNHFPDLDKVLPKIDEPAIQVCLAVDVLERICKVAKAAHQNGPRTAAITFYVRTADKHRAGKQVPGPVYTDAIRIEIASLDVHVDGVVMPFQR